MTDIARRTLLASGAGIALGALLDTPAASAGTTRRPVYFGANHNVWDKFSARIPAAKAARIFYGRRGHMDQIPLHWPTRITLANGQVMHATLANGTPAWATLSIRLTPSKLLAGELDDRLIAMIQTAPEHAELTIDHEAGGNDPLAYGVSQRTLQRMHAHMVNLCRTTKTQHGHHVQYGQITCGPVSQLAAKGWIADDLDWRGTDMYFNAEHYASPGGTVDRGAVNRRLDDAWAAWGKLGNGGRRYPRVRICETNAMPPAHRNTWFSYQAAWMHEHGGGRIMTFWHIPERARSGDLSGDWPPGRACIDHLRWLAKIYG